MVRSRFVLLVVAAGLAATGCARLAGAGAGEPTSVTTFLSPPPGDTQATDWDHPFQGQGLLVGSVEAAKDVNFPIVTPTALGNPAGIYVTPEPPSTAAVAFMYDSPVYGRVIVIESLPDIPDAQARMQAYQDRVANNGQPGFWTTSEIVTLNNGDPAIVGTSKYYSATIEWVDSDVQFSVIGPQLTGDQAVAIANGL